MTTYWKSQDRKYCEFCKCWFADNKVSISFHENGKKHKESVKKHITQLSKRSAKEFKQKEKIEDDIKKMEAAAMSAYLKDIENNAQDLTSQSINEILEVSGSSSKDIVISSNIDTKEIPKWKEVQNEEKDGTYFWNTQTNETTWDPPDNYISLAQEEEKKQKEIKDTQKREKRLQKQKEKEAILEVKAHMSRERMREFAVEKEKPPPYKTFGPAPMSKPYGSWKPIVKEPEVKIDLQLPKSEKEVIPPPVVMEPEVIQFKEKRVESLGEGPVEFKKRKLNKRNARQKLDDD